MPNTKSAKKRLRQSLVQKVHNKAIRTRVRNAIKKARAAAEADDPAAPELTRLAQRLLDRAASKGLLTRGAAGRRKSRLARRLPASP